MFRSLKTIGEKKGIFNISLNENYLPQIAIEDFPRIGMNSNLDIKFSMFYFKSSKKPS